MRTRITSIAPDKLPRMSDKAYTALHLATISSRLALEERTLVNHITGRAENVAEHSHMLTIVAPGIAEKYYPHLDANLVCRFASIHDAVEAYVGDTATHDITNAGLIQKDQLEAEGLQQLKQDFASTMPKFVELIEQYEAQNLAEARFVCVIDKWTPILLHFGDKGATVRAYTNPEEIIENYKPRAERLKQKYPDFAELVSVREELTELISKHLF